MLTKHIFFLMRCADLIELHVLYLVHRKFNVNCVLCVKAKEKQSAQKSDAHLAWTARRAACLLGWGRREGENASDIYVLTSISHVTSCTALLLL